ncbi:Wzz/FepE/Etk N-terminal domain-containing protein [Paracoccus denitrificans]|uniref:GumC family protein n=1 Tax=Paracoccus denitrificans TaxID=266 RepID=UPI001E39F9F3|nr:Wzz/FepE/Etk N-terminal domain-containing protein [Paracoccus denitrificans]UFS64346.1 Wzz/FepE/Etk N-terminal domain-containing protein [Paracoccus denitrificans]
MQDLISMIWRRLPLVLTIMVLGVLISFYLIISSPRIYQASAVIQLDMPAAIDQGSDSSLPASRRVQLIEQRLMARANLREVIQRLGLFADTQLSETEKLGALRSSTRIESITAPGVSVESRMSLAAIVITAQAETPATAAAIANDFADSVVNRDRENRQLRMLESQEYLRNEERRLNEQLSEQERQAVEFSARNEDSLPSSQEFLQTELAQLTEMETALDRDIMTLQRERLSLEAGGLATETRPSASLVQQIRSAEVELAQARRTLSPDHPEIKRLEGTLERLNSGVASGGSDVIRRQAELIDAQLAKLNEQKAGIIIRRTEIDHARARAPEVSRELEAMTRQQRRLQDRYNEISRQLAQVETQQMLMENDQAERFVLLERALPPEYPAMSNRKKSAVMGAGASMGLALAVAFVLELLNPVLRRGDQFTRVTGTRPVVSLPYRLTAADLRKRRLRNIYMILLLVLGIFIALWLIGQIPGLPSPGVVSMPTDGMG